MGYEKNGLVQFLSPRLGSFCAATLEPGLHLRNRRRPNCVSQQTRWIWRMALQRCQTTGISIRPAALDADRKVLVETLARYLNPLSDERRFDWLYRENPHGQGRAWIACGPDNSTIVGMAAAFPRRIWIGGAENVGWVLGDFCVSDQNRSLGPALQLQRACLAG